MNEYDYTQKSNIEVVIGGSIGAMVLVALTIYCWIWIYLRRTARSNSARQEATSTDRDRDGDGHGPPPRRSSWPWSRSASQPSSHTSSFNGDRSVGSETVCSGGEKGLYDATSTISYRDSQISSSSYSSARAYIPFERPSPLHTLPPRAHSISSIVVSSSSPGAPLKHSPTSPAFPSPAISARSLGDQQQRRVSWLSDRSARNFDTLSSPSTVAKDGSSV